MIDEKALDRLINIIEHIDIDYESIRTEIGGGTLAQMKELAKLLKENDNEHK